MTQKQLFVLSFFGFILLILAQLIGVFWLFISPLSWAIILALVFYPLYGRFVTLLKGRKSLSALFVCFLVILVTLAPLIFFSGTIVREFLGFYRQVGAWVEAKQYEVVWQHVMDSPLKRVWEVFNEKTSGIELNLGSLITQSAQTISETIAKHIQAGAKNFIVFIFRYCLAIFILFFFLRDGEALGRGLKDLFPMSRENKLVVFSRLTTTVSAVVQGQVITGGAQGLLGGIAYWVLGVPYPVFLAVLTSFLALIPVGGAVFVWLPSALYLYLTGHWGKGIALFLWGALVISMIDNILKPLLIGGKTNIPTLFLFLSILGGIAFYGIIGIFLGPVMLTLFLTLIEIYRRDYPEER